MQKHEYVSLMGLENSNKNSDDTDSLLYTWLGAKGALEAYDTDSDIYLPTLGP